MKLSKKILAFLLVGAMVLTTGCGIVESVQIDEKGNMTVTDAHVYYSKDDMLSLEALSDYSKSAKKGVLAEGFLADYTTTEIDGVTYYEAKNTDDTETLDTASTVKGNGGYYNANTFEMAFATYGQDNESITEALALYNAMDFGTFNITFPYQVLAANGTISEDGYTVSYDFVKGLRSNGAAGYRMYAAFTETAKSSTDITISGVANGKTYSANKTVTVTSAGTVTALKVNGKSIEGRKVTLKNNGNYKVYVKLLSGTTRTVKFSIKKYYKLTYKVNGGKALKKTTKKVRYGNKYGKLATPTRKGYKFLGWYTKKSGGKKVTAKTVCKGKATVYAHWKKK